MKKTIQRETALRIIANIRRQYADEELLNESGDDINATDARSHAVTTLVAEEYAGVSNSFLSEILEAVSGFRTEIVGEPAILFPCPCCGFRTLGEVYNPMEGTGYDVCAHCGWEDDGTADDSTVSSVNRKSMAQLRLELSAEDGGPLRTKWLR